MDFTWRSEAYYYLLYYIQRIIFFRRSFFLYSPYHYMKAWIRVLDAPGCYERAGGEKVHTTRLRRTSSPFCSFSWYCNNPLPRALVITIVFLLVSSSPWNLLWRPNFQYQSKMLHQTFNHSILYFLCLYWASSILAFTLASISFLLELISSISAYYLSHSSGS